MKLGTKIRCLLCLILLIVCNTYGQLINPPLLEEVDKALGSLSPIPSFSPPNEVQASPFGTGGLPSPSDHVPSIGQSALGNLPDFNEKMKSLSPIPDVAVTEGQTKLLEEQASKVLSDVNQLLNPNGYTPPVSVQTSLPQVYVAPQTKPPEPSNESNSVPVAPQLPPVPELEYSMPELPPNEPNLPELPAPTTKTTGIEAQIEKLQNWLVVSLNHLKAQKSLANTEAVSIQHRQQRLQKTLNNTKKTQDSIDKIQKKLNKLLGIQAVELLENQLESSLDVFKKLKTESSPKKLDVLNTKISQVQELIRSLHAELSDKESPVSTFDNNGSTVKDMLKDLDSHFEKHLTSISDQQNALEAADSKLENIQKEVIDNKRTLEKIVSENEDQGLSSQIDSNGQDSDESITKLENMEKESLNMINDNKLALEKITSENEDQGLSSEIESNDQATDESIEQLQSDDELLNKALELERQSAKEAKNISI